MNRSEETTTGIVNSVDQMMRLPLQMTGATWDLMMKGMRSVTGTRGEWDSTPSHEPMFPIFRSQDLSGEDLKYVVWTIVFTKPGLECVLEPQHTELVNYNADGSSFAAMKIAKFLEKARHGHVEKPESWHDHDYPPEFVKETGAGKPASSSHEHGWRIPAEDHKYLTFLHRVEWRLPKQVEVTRVGHATVDRTTRNRVRAEAPPHRSSEHKA